ncbi:MAG: RNA polymerase sigma factor, partial [Pseudomonadota bacterium]
MSRHSPKASPRAEERTSDAATRVDVEALLERILIRQRQAFLGYLGRRLGDHDEAQDVLANFALRVVLKSDQLNNPEAIDAWLRRVLHSTLIDHIRQNAARRLSTVDVDDLAADEEPAEDKEPDAAVAHLCACMRSVIPQLKAEYADILQRADLEEQSRAEIAESLQISTGNLRVRLYRARQALRAALAERCGAHCQDRFLSCACDS